MKKFNANGICYPDKHYMMNLCERLRKISILVDEGNYITINHAKQYGKTTMSYALKGYLQEKYTVIFINFQRLSALDHRDEYAFASAFADLFMDAFDKKDRCDSMSGSLMFLQETAEGVREKVGLRQLFKILSYICCASFKPFVLMIDEAGHASNSQVFLDFLAQLQAYYLNENREKTFWSVILIGFHDIRNLKLKIHSGTEQQYKSPWNIAADFNIDMSFQVHDIKGMLEEYEQDYHMGMDLSLIARMLYDYTSGYPFLVSRLCKILDEMIPGREGFPGKADAWTENGMAEAVKELLVESNILFDDMIKKLTDFPELKKLLYSILFKGERISYNVDNYVIHTGQMFGYIENREGVAAISNRIFETRLYNLFMSEEILNSSIYKAADAEKSKFIKEGQLDMEMVLERFVEAFTDIYSDGEDSFLEENGRRFFLLYLKPIINGRGNYYIEARTRDMRRTDIVIDYCGKQYICEMKIWHGEEHHNRGKKQLLQYLEDYHLSTGYMLSFNFNKNKRVGIHKELIDGKLIIEAVV